MAPVQLADLSEEDQAFVGLMATLHEQLDAQRLAFPAGKRLTAIEALQEAVRRLTKAAIDLPRP